MVVVRDHYARFISAYGTYVTAGGCLSIEDYAKSMLASGTRHMSVRETLRNWEAAFGPERIKVIDYDAEQNIISPILRQCGVAHAALDAEKYRDRVSLGADVIQALQLANQKIALKQGAAADRGFAAWLQLSLFTIICRRQLAAASVGHTSEPWRLSEQTLQRLDAIAADDGAWLERSYGLRARGSSLREKLLVGQAQPSTVQELLAKALVQKVTSVSWNPSQALVSVLAKAFEVHARMRGVRCDP